jgi:Domain of unknown function (DUF4281)
MERGMEILFKISGILVLPFWLLMIFAPNWQLTRRLTTSVWICAAPAVVYAALVTPRIAQILPVVASPELPDVMRLLGSDSGATIAWLHFLAFDLFVGRWAYQDSFERNISRLVMAPVLLLILLLGPIGMVLYLVIRTVASKHADV